MLEQVGFAANSRTIRTWRLVFGWHHSILRLQRCLASAEETINIDNTELYSAVRNNRDIYITPRRWQTGLAILRRLTAAQNCEAFEFCICSRKLDRWIVSILCKTLRGFSRLCSVRCSPQKNWTMEFDRLPLVQFCKGKKIGKRMSHSMSFKAKVAI